MTEHGFMPRKLVYIGCSPDKLSGSSARKSFHSTFGDDKNRGTGEQGPNVNKEIGINPCTLIQM